MAMRDIRICTLPMLVLRGLVCFPETVNHFDVGRLKSVEALNAAMEKDQRIFLVAQRDVTVDDPSPRDLYRMGVVAHIRQIIKLPNNNFRIIVEGEYRATVLEVLKEEPFYLVSFYGGEATKDRLDAIFTPEVLKVIWRDYGRFVFAPEKKNVEKELKRLGIIDGAGEEKPSKKGLFGLFRK